MEQRILLKNYYNKLLKYFGNHHWCPGETPFEVMVGAVLTQNTNWQNVARAIDNLKNFNLLDPYKIHELDHDTLAMAIKPAGYFNVKAKRLKNFVGWFVENYHGEIRKLKQRDPSALREELLSISGIGKETCDSILLYALNIPTFVVDAYTYRVFSRHQLVPEETSYDEMKEFFESNLSKNKNLFNEYHALIVAVGKEFCRTKPKCEMCPLKCYLPSNF